MTRKDTVSTFRFLSCCLHKFNLPHTPETGSKAPSGKKILN